MNDFILKVKISALWFFMAIATMRCTHWMETGAIEKVLSGEWQASLGEMFIVTFWWWIPLIMAFITLTLKDVMNRKTNIVLGIIFTGMNIFHFVEHLMEPTAHALMIVGSTVVVAVLIVWYAWKWPKQEK